jgi:pimeloyl-ACP methyl ester carboxylesterase
MIATPVALAYRFAIVYRRRAGFPARRSPVQTPADLGLAFEVVAVPSAAGPLAGWFVPARDGLPGPGVVIVHGWESGRDRTLPHAQFLHAAGFHCLLIDVRGHGENPPEELPISAGEFAADAEAGLRALLARPEVTGGAILGHSMGAAGALVAAAAAADRCAAVVSVSAPADPHLLTRETFRLARLPIPAPVAHPLAWVTARVYVRPRGHSIGSISARDAVRAYRGPILIVHGERDEVIPVGHADRLERAAVRARSRAAASGRRRSAAEGTAADATAAPGPVVRYIVPGGGHSWLYEDEGYRRTVAAFLARALGGPYPPEEAAELAAAVPAVRPPEPETRFSALA